MIYQVKPNYILPVDYGEENIINKMKMQGKKISTANIM